MFEVYTAWPHDSISDPITLSTFHCAGWHNPDLVNIHFLTYFGLYVAGAPTPSSTNKIKLEIFILQEISEDCFIFFLPQIIFVAENRLVSFLEFDIYCFTGERKTFRQLD